MRLSLGQRAMIRLGELLQRRAPWHELPKPRGLICLVGIRTRLRQLNLYDPAQRPDGGQVPAPGAAFTPFGRNFPLWEPPEDDALMEPSPREVSRRLLARNGEFQAVPFLNLMAAAWLQFMVHDWMSHGPGDGTRLLAIPLAPDDDWPDPSPDGLMTVPRTIPSARHASGGPPLFDNTETHWWDGSQIYGSTPERQALLRAGEGGLLTVDAEGLLPVEEGKGIDLTGVNGNWWLGLALLHTLFVREHNAIARHLAERHPDWDDERLFSVARRVNAAVMAKIHTVEWTPSVLPNKITRAAMHANWSGLLGPRAARLLRRFTRSDLLIGIPGSRFDDHGVRYALTEEFVSVYRMHPLIPDDIPFRSASSGADIESRGMTDITGTAARRVLESHRMEDLFATFGLVHAGMIRLHNYPESLRQLSRSRPDSAPGADRVVDLASIDILRDRERGVPRYNEFRRMLRLPPARDFMHLTGADEDPAKVDTAKEIEELYGDVERVDLMIGLYAEPPLEGFGFSETAFHIFALMASRRLKSDPLFTDDYRPEVYSPEGMRWIEEATMTGVVARHLPELALVMGDLVEFFNPWDRPVNRRSGDTAPFDPSDA